MRKRGIVRRISDQSPFLREVVEVSVREQEF